MKLFVVFALFIVAAQATPYYMPPGLVNAETHEEFLKEFESTATGAKVGEKIASGTEAKKGEFPEFCYISTQFYEKSMSCGCWIYAKQHVVTSARCVMDCSEGIAANVTVTIPAISGKDGIFKIEKIYVPDAVNSVAPGLMAYVPGATYTAIEANNIAVIKLAAAIPEAKLGAAPKDSRIAKVDIMADADAATFVARYAKDNYKFRACGVGVIGNKGERAKGVVCTDVNFITDPMLCKEPYGDAAAVPFPIPANQYCMQWPDRDNNICVGDFGGPVYAYKLTDKGVVDGAGQIVVCTMVGSPNVRKNAPCLDGHITFCTAASGPIGLMMMGINAWVDSIVTPVAG